MRKLTYLFLGFSLFIFSGCSLRPGATPTPTPSPIVGGDVDAHGCKASAGYAWCEPLNKCIRPWDEQCQSNTSSVDEPAIIKTAVKKALIAKHGQSAADLDITISDFKDNYSKGGASAKGQGGGMWFAAKVNNAWQLVWDGNGIIQCSDLTNFSGFPNDIIPECYDDKTGKMVKR